MGSKVISIIFCGDCKPMINSAKLAKQLSIAFQSKGWKVIYNEINADFYIFLNACSVGCIIKEIDFSCSKAIVAGDSLNAVNVNETDLVYRVLKGVIDYFGEGGK